MRCVSCMWQCITDTSRSLRAFHWRLTLVSAAMVISGHARLAAQHLEADSTSIAVIVDARSLPDSLQGRILGVIARRIGVAAWPTYRIEAGDIVYALIARRFGYDDRHPATRDTVLNLIAAANDPLDLRRLQIGTNLRIPSIPSRPRDGALPNRAQLLGWSGNEVALVMLDERIYSSSPIQVAGQLSDGSTWIVTGTAKELQEFDEIVDKVPAGVDAKRAIYHGPLSTNLAVAPPPSGVVADSEDLKLPSLGVSRTIVSGIDPGRAGRYYVLDFYRTGESCPHGRKVLDVIYKTLADYGADEGFEHIVEPIEIDFFRNRDEGLLFLRQYAALAYTEATNRGILAQIQSLESQQPLRTAVPVIPGIYLQALFWRLMKDTTASIVSTSSWTQTDGSASLPDDFSPEASLLLLAAVLDEPIEIENNHRRREPIQSLHRLRNDYGFVLVGAERAPGSSHGMYSRLGDGVTTLGYGAGWRGSCISPSDIGTSFATPHVATLLFLARAYWKAQGTVPSPIEIRRRLLLSTDVVSNYVGRFASAGIPRLERLLQPKGAFAVTIGDTLVPVTVVRGVVTLTDTATKLRSEKMLRDTAPAIGGIQYVGGKYVVFEENEPGRGRWVGTPVLTGLDLTVTINGATATYNAQSFSERFKSLVVY